jgi:tetratricopeptide (TPR) repeat protein
MEASPDIDPRVRVELLNILGSSFMSLGETETAETVSARALQEARENLSPDDALALRAGILRSWVLMYRGKTSEARSALDEVFAAVDRGISLPDEELVLAWRVRCGLDVDAGNREEAVTAGREAVRLADERLPDENQEKLLALLELAYAYQQSRRNPEAFQVAQRAYRLAVDTHPDNPLHPNVIKARARLGNDLAGVERLEEGIQELEQAVRDATTVFGPSSMTVGVYLQNLVSFQLQAGMVKGALESSKRSLEICERYFEPDSLTRMSSARARGMALIAARRASESLSPLTEAHDAAARIYGPSDRVTLSVRAMRALALAHTGAVAEARGDIQAVVDEAVRENVIPVFQPLRYNGLVERLAGNFAAALDLQERALEVAHGPARSHPPGDRHASRRARELRHGHRPPRRGR